MTARVHPDSLVTLHYRVTTSDGSELISTFGTTPATLQLGNGELAPPLEACLVDLPVGERQVFMREPAEAFGAHNPDLVKRLLLGELPNDGADLAPHAVIEFTAPGGGKFAGLVRDLDATAALIDFNHPLAGKSIRFEVEVIGIL
ncbi:MAG: FKBP-type peptidyl-prolyl cis-trans isomerase [Rhodocyclaceae bacterium]|jgi:FKBP-type peptidyl-prolyl cis-trans isomerase SlpA|nr:FKBP-type peptidyl-prolyl cis-trans isomerase [Rhodocyclaceae bacterium]